MLGRLVFSSEARVDAESHGSYKDRGIQGTCFGDFFSVGLLQSRVRQISRQIR